MSKYLQDIKKELSDTEKEIKRLKNDKEMYEQLISQIVRQINSLNNYLLLLKRKYDTFEQENFLTDHAIVRYLERSGLIDIKKIKEHLLTPEVLLDIYSSADKIKINDFDFRIKNGKIATIINEKGEDE